MHNCHYQLDTVKQVESKGETVLPITTLLHGQGQTLAREIERRERMALT